MSFPWCYFTCFYLLLGFGVDLADSQIYRRFGDKILPYYTIVVDPLGHGNFTKIQDAIKAVPSNNRYWTSIYVKAGTYSEKLIIRQDQPYIFLQGEGEKITRVEWADHEGITQSPTFSTWADNIIVKRISFINTYNKKVGPVDRAVAALVSGDKCYFLNVGFFGIQDTLWDVDKRHYYKSCSTQGATDFIFGAGQSLYDDCHISVIDGRLGPGISGFITAQGREHPQDTNGFVFKNCAINGTGTSYLGRAWKEYARVIFYKTLMDNIIDPNRWDQGFSKNLNDISFGEYANTGAGSHPTKKIGWVNKMDITTVRWLTSLSFIDNDGWLKISLRMASS